MIADQMEEWLASRACDGFNIMFPYGPGGLDDFVDRVVPELQRRGLFRREYEGRTLRENSASRVPKTVFSTDAGFDRVASPFPPRLRRERRVGAAINNQ